MALTADVPHQKPQVLENDLFSVLKRMEGELGVTFFAWRAKSSGISQVLGEQMPRRCAGTGRNKGRRSAQVIALGIQR
jgi:hypothetical protein